MHSFRVLACSAVVLVLAGCATRSSQTITPMPSAAATPITFNTWVARSAEYPGLVQQIYRHATTTVDAAVAGRPRRSWAVILDADETVISNVAFQIELENAGLTFTPATWNAWTRRRAATPLPGAKAFLDHVRTRGGQIAIVTNRLESECADTRAVFDAQQLAYDVMLCRPDGSPSEKNTRFRAVAAGQWPGATGPVEVVAWLGDNIHDFPELDQSIRAQGAEAYTLFGTRYFLFPNPMYGGWQ